MTTEAQTKQIQRSSMSENRYCANETARRIHNQAQIDFFCQSQVYREQQDHMLVAPQPTSYVMVSAYLKVFCESRAPAKKKEKRTLAHIKLAPRRRKKRRKVK